MEFRRADAYDLDAIKNFYQNLIANTKNIEKYARWHWNFHPTEKMIEDYVNENNMYLYMESNQIAGAMAITMSQGSDYHDVAWKTEAADDKAAVIHILGVSPAYQGRGIGKQMIEEAMKLAKNSGKTVLRLDSLASNTPAQNMYREKGFSYCGKKTMYAENTGWTDFYFYENKLGGI